MTDAELSGVAHSVHGHHGRKGRRIGDADGMLRGAGVGRAYRTDLAVGPRLLGDPLQQVRAVWPVVANRAPFAFGAVSASNILEHDGIATRDEIFHDIVCRGVLVVDRPLDNRRKTTDYRAASSRCVNVRRQTNTVASSDHDVARGDDLVMVAGLGVRVARAHHRYQTHDG